MDDRTSRIVGRREVIKGTAMLAVAAAARAGTQTTATQTEPATSLANIPLSPNVTLTVERRGDIVLVGLNRPFIQNRIDPPTRLRLAETFYQYEHDPSLRALVLFGHGENFSRGIDVDAAQAGIISGNRPTSALPTLDPLGNAPAASDRSRSSSSCTATRGISDTRSTWPATSGSRRRTRASGRTRTPMAGFPGGGATVRFVREAGWGNAMRYMLTGDHWTAEESYRMGITQQIAPTPEAALDAGIAFARKMAACGPLSIKATLVSGHQYVDPVEADALSKLGAQYAALYKTEDFLEGRRAEAEGRPPKYQGK